MRIAKPWALALIWLLAATLAAAAESIGVVEVRVVEADRLPAVRGATHELVLTAHLFRGSRWDPDEIASALVESARLLAQCGVAVSAVELRVIEAPRRFHVYHTPVSRELLRSLEARRPALFFVEDTKNHPAFDAEAIGLSNAKPRPELANTVWVAHGARDLVYVIAHELVHVLSNSGAHSEEPGNLMRAETAPGNGTLTAVQCGHLRSRGEANGMLKRRTTDPKS